MEYVVEVCRLASVEEPHLVWWLNSKSESTRRQRLHGWRLWQEFCVENEVGPEGLATLVNPAITISRFIKANDEMNTPFYLIKESMTAIKELLEIANPNSLLLLRDSIIVKQSLQGAMTGVVKGTRYRQIWKLEVMLQFVARGPPTEELGGKDLMARAAFLFMVFIPCRPVGMWRMDVSGERWAEDGLSVEVPAREKTNHGKEVTMLAIRQGTVPNLCPLKAYKRLKEGARARETGGALWCSEQGALYKQPSFISRLIKALLMAAGVPAHFPAYSVRHALIIFLFALGWSEIRVNAFTGHSNNSHTAVTHYFHLDEKWLGKEIGRAVPQEVAVQAEDVIRKDNRVARLESGEDVEAEEKQKEMGVVGMEVDWLGKAEGGK
jgi:hypothetical protein